MKCVIHHAYFLPWLGYFSKLAFADKFILLDDAQFSKGFYHDRTKYVTSNGDIKWLSIPVGQNFKKECRSVYLKDKEFLQTFIKRIEHSYAKARYFKSDWPVVKEILIECIGFEETLFDLNICIIKSVANLVGLNLPQIYYSSELITEDTYDKTNKIISYCNACGCDSLIIGDGHSTTEHDLKRIEGAGIEILQQKFYSNHPIYFQVRRQQTGFVKGLSILDSILNIGIERTHLLITDSQHTPKPFSYD